MSVSPKLHDMQTYPSEDAGFAVAVGTGATLTPAGAAGVDVAGFPS